MFCEKCGGELRQDKNLLVCQKCGAEYGLDYSEVYSADYSAGGERVASRGFSSKKNIIIIVIAALVVLGGIGAAVAFGVSHSVSQSALSGFQLAEKYLSEQNYEQAIIAFEQVLEIEPMNVDAYLGLADAYLGTGDTDKALEILRKGLEMTGDARLKAKIDELTKPVEPPVSSTSSGSVTVSKPVESEPAFGSMGSVTILGTEVDIATTKQLVILNPQRLEERKKAKLETHHYYHHRDYKIKGYCTVIEIADNLTEMEISEITAQTKLLVKLHTLVVEYVGIKDISPFCGLENIRVLSLCGNDISDLSPITRFEKLSELRLFDNDITDISPLSTMSQLTWLDIGGNFFTDLSPVSNLTDLKYLGIDGGDIIDITPLAGLTNLINLYLGSNQISDITPLAGLTNLNGLNLWGNQISEADKAWLKEQLPNCDVHF